MSGPPWNEDELWNPDNRLKAVEMEDTMSEGAEEFKQTMRNKLEELKELGAGAD